MYTKNKNEHRYILLLLSKLSAYKPNSPLNMPLEKDTIDCSHKYVSFLLNTYDVPYEDALMLAVDSCDVRSLSYLAKSIPKPNVQLKKLII